MVSAWALKRLYTVRQVPEDDIYGGASPAKDHFGHFPCVTFSLQPCHQVSVIAVPSLQMRKLRQGGVKELAQGVKETCPHPLHHFEGVLGRVR